MISIAYEQSFAHFARANHIPGRSSTRSKAPGRLFEIGSGPLYASSGDPGRVRDVDGNYYIDMLCALGAISIGHGFGRSVTHEGDGVYSLPHYMEIAVAEKMLEAVGWGTHVRLLKTGSEATHAAYRVAKRATGRSHVLIGDWAYHGWHEWCSRTQDGIPESPTTFLYPHGGDLGDNHFGAPQDIAAVFVEPHRWERVDVQWLRSLREFCTRHGILLVFDEMIYGGRWSVGGGSEFFGVEPDLACYGKAFGNGASFACVVGKEALRDHGEIVSGTYSGDAGVLSQVAAVLDEYAKGVIVPSLWACGEILRQGVQEAIDSTGWTGLAVLEGSAVHQRLRFTEKPQLGRLFSAGMASHGVLWHPDVVNVCAQHTEEQLEAVGHHAAATLWDMKGRR